MPDPANLPPELFDKALSQVATDISSAIATNFAHSDPDSAAFHACCLVSRTWNANSTPRLYSRWIYDGTHGNFTRLWKFLRTIWSKPAVATLVHSAGIKGLKSNPSYHKSLLVEEQESIRNAMQMAGMGEAQSLTLHAPDLTDPRLLMALVMTCLPSLKTLEASIYNNDQHFRQVLRLASRNSTFEQPRRQAFQNLIQLSLFMRESSGPNDPDLGAEGIWPVFGLPCIRKLSLFEVPDRLTIPHYENDARTSPVTHLAAIEWDSSCFSFAATKRLLTLPNRLVHLSLYMYDYDLPPYSVYSLSNEAFSRLLAVHQNSLEYLDFCRQRPEGLRQPHSLTHTHMDLLRSFRSLKSLLIHPEDLLGGCCGSPKAPFRLGDTLPPNLGSLTFYASGDLPRLPAMEEEITEAICDKDHASLKTLVLEKTDGESRGSKDSVDASWRTLRGACEEMAIDFRVADCDTLPMGGSNIPAHRRSWGNRSAGADVASNGSQGTLFSMWP